MRLLRAALLRLAALFGRTRRDRELATELDSHLQLLIDDNLRAGMTPGEARRQALARFGGIDAVTESYRDRRGVPLIETTLQDARYALRTLRTNPLATAIGIVVMALGIGANTAVFSVVHAVLLNPLPYANPDRIVTLTYGLGASERARQVSLPDFRDWKTQSTLFEAMAYYSSSRGSAMTGQVAEYAGIATVGNGFFEVFAAQPAAGRLFAADDARQGGAAVISDHYARQQFGDPAAALGKNMRVLNRPFAIVGVLPPSFDFPAANDIWILDFADRSTAPRRGNNFLAVARMRPNSSQEQAQAEMTAISARLEQQYPDTNRNFRVRVTPLQREMVGDVRSMLYLLLGAVALVLLIACATMATLLLAKATARAPEMAVRAALGASRSRMVKQLLVEAGVQALAAGTLGVLIAVWGTHALVALAPADVPRLGEVEINGRVLLFTAAVSMLVSLLFGLPPALQASRANVSDPLRQGSTRVSGGSRTREMLVIAEMALAVILVVTGALLVRSVIALQRTPLGFHPENVVVMRASARPSGSDWKDSRAYFEGVLTDLARLPGVIAAGAMMGPPGRVSSESGYWIDQMPKQSPLHSAKAAVMNVIAPGSFAALGVPILQGRDFEQSDRLDRPRVVIVNEALARSAFPGREAIGRVIIAGFDSSDPMTIVGVVGDVRQYGPAREPQPEIFMPYQQHFYNGATLHVLVRTSGDPSAMGAAVARVSRERSPEVSIRVSTMEALLAEGVATPTFRAWLLSLFAGVALCLAMAGVYGVMAYVAGQRSKEIGVRMALGATPRSVLWLMLGRGLTLTSIGLAVGVGGALASSRLLSGMLFQVTARDASTYIVVAIALGALSLLATFVPAHRATKIDPLRVLRQE